MLVGLAVCALNTASSAQMPTGMASGRWTTVNASTVELHATMFNLREQPMYSLDAKLHGRDIGLVTGTISGLPRPADGIYRVEGKYARQPDGRVLVEVKIILDLQRPDGSGSLVVGHLRGTLDPYPMLRVIDPTVFGMPWPGGPTPVATPNRGHFHARWWM
jgi:hypothetical protein